MLPTQSQGSWLDHGSFVRKLFYVFAMLCHSIRNSRVYRAEMRHLHGPKNRCLCDVNNEPPKYLDGFQYTGYALVLGMSVSGFSQANGQLILLSILGTEFKTIMN